MLWRYCLGDATLVCIIFPLLQLALIHLLIHSMHLAHFLDLIQVDHEALFICMILPYTLSAEDCQVIRAIKVLHPLIMLVTEQAINTIFILEINVSQNAVSFDNFVQDIEV